MNQNNIQASIDSIETFGLVDGPGIRVVVFFNGCHLRCIYCHNPEMWSKQNNNMTVDELVSKILKNKEYFGESGGVTFSGGEPLLHADFIIEVCKELKKHNIHIALDTAGVGNGNYEEILEYVDLVILDIKHVSKFQYFDLTGYKMDESLEFIKCLNNSNKKVWIRQVIVPGLMDNTEYLESLSEMVHKIKNVEKIEFLPYHKLGSEKYIKLGITDFYRDLEEMDKDKCMKLYDEFMKIYDKELIKN